MDARLAARKHDHARHAREACELLVSKWRLQRIEVRRLLLQVLSGELLTFTPAEQVQALRALCTELVDYVSIGHFEIYGRILPRKLRADCDTHALLQHIFDNIGKSTDTVLSFNDRLQQHDDLPPGAPLRQALIRLSRALLLRFALEEQLLELCGY
ncbi:MAG: Rsd/AlgQ family anti-sigma factor [Pseudomonadota bacterium]|nr:Rsd/AlgQ family anti-sigma factor [Pseudomonadota bacterium]